jgi:hypothetical protein
MSILNKEIPTNKMSKAQITFHITKQRIYIKQHCSTENRVLKDLQYGSLVTYKMKLECSRDKDKDGSLFDKTLVKTIIFLFTQQNQQVY